MNERAVSNRRCPSINPWDPEDRCALTADNDHEYGHEGRWNCRNVTWNASPIEVADTSKDYWDVVPDG